MQLPLSNFSTIVQQSAAAAQAAFTQVLDFTVGSLLRALLEANASIVLWLQWLIVLVLQTTRFATSSGPDADSFGADFGFFRLPAVAATGYVTFSRYSTSLTAMIPLGATVATADGLNQFGVYLDTTNTAWSPTASAYILGAGISSVTVPVQAIAPGSNGNVLPNMITLITAPIPGVDSVSNTNALSGGIAAETDASYRGRFQSFLDSRSRSTLEAIKAAVINLQQGLSCTIQENTDLTGAYHPGNFQVTVDDGSGSPPTTLLTAAQAAIEAVRPIGSTFAVMRPTMILADISLTLVFTSSTNASAGCAAVNSAITQYVNSLAVGAGLAYTKLAQIAYDAAPGITNVLGLTLQGAAQDLAPNQTTVIRLGTIAINS